MRQVFIPFFIIIAVAVSSASSVHAATKVSRPSAIIADKDGSPIAAAPAAVDLADAVTKIEALGPGVYTVDLGVATVVVEGQPVIPVVNNLGGNNPIVYTRVPRTTATKEISGATIGNWAYMDTLPEVGRISTDFNAPGQLIIRQPDGSEEIIYDCTNKPKPCVPMDAMPSLDGTKIAFTVISSDGVKPPWPENKNYPPKHLNGVNNSARIYIYDIASKQLTPWPDNAHVDVSPVWLPNGKIVFASNRHNTYPPKHDRIVSQSQKPRLYMANSDGTNVVDISPHEVAGAIHPYVTNEGRIVYSAFWASHGFMYTSTNGGINWPGTIDNHWRIVDTDLNGGDFTAILGAHKASIPNNNTSTATNTTPASTMKALHFISQRTNGDVCTTNYYRSNNLGLGDVICRPDQGKGIEGPANKGFMPQNTYFAALWAQSEDAKSKEHNGKYLGKIGYSEGAEDGQLILAAGFGHCTTVATGVPSTNNYIGSRKDCDVGLYKTTQIPSRSPDDLVLIVDDPNWHEFMPRVIKPRTVAQPALSTTSDGTCEVVSTDVMSTDAHFQGTYEFNNMYKMAGNNGNEIVGLPHSDVTAVRFYEVLPNLTPGGNAKNSTGNRLRLLGDAPLLSDNSMKATVPCNTPFVMAGVDSQGRILKRDIIPQSLRPGEKRVCGGCHQHSEQPTRTYQQSVAFNATPTNLTSPIPVPTYTNDILPIVNSKCMSCHGTGGELPLPLDDYNKLVLDPFQEHVPASLKLVTFPNQTNKRKWGLHRPQISKYVSTMFARESLFYWKAINQRTDGRTDAQYPNDIDFGAAHPTTLTSAEITTIAAWLDSGATL